MVDPATGKINQDMLANSQRLNRYVYALNNPYKYVDPDGESPLLIVALAAAFLVADALMPVSTDVPDSKGALDYIDDSTMFLPTGQVKNAAKNVVKNAGPLYKTTKETTGAAKVARMKNLGKGIPLKQLGPSGKPKIHATKHSSLKKAKDAARAKAGEGVLLSNIHLPR